MSMMPLLIVAALMCVGALVGTIMIGMKPEDEQYDKKSKKHFWILSIIYLVTFVPALILTVLYYIYG